MLNYLSGKKTKHNRNIYRIKIIIKKNVFENKLTFYILCYTH